MAWYAVRCVIAFREGAYEERITLWQAQSGDEAIALAEAEVSEYVQDTCLLGYAGLAQAYEIGESQPESGDEIFSLIRRSHLSTDDYVTAFFDTGSEHQSSR